MNKEPDGFDIPPRLRWFNELSCAPVGFRLRMLAFAWSASYGAGDGWRSKMPVTLLTNAPVAQDPFEPSKLETAAKWSSAGFAALTSVLTFFGIKDGMLTRILAEEPTASLWVMILVGSGVVLSLFGIAVQNSAHLFAGWLVLGIIAMSACSALLLKDINETGVTKWMLGIAFAVLFFGLFRSWKRRTTIALAAGLLVLAVTATSLGLYAAAKISIAAKAAPEDLRVRAKLTGEAPAQSLEVTLAGSKQNDGMVAVVGYRTERDRDTKTGKPVPSAEGRQLWQSYFNVDETRAVSETYTIPVNTRHWAEVSIQACTKRKDDKDSKGKAKTSSEQPVCSLLERSSYLTGTALKPAAALSGAMAVSDDGKLLTATVAGSSVDPGQHVAIRFSPRGKKARAKVITVLKATALPDASGSVTWTAKLPVQGVRWALHAVVCDDEDPRPKTSTEEGSNPFLQADAPCRARGKSHILAIYRP